MTEYGISKFFSGELIDLFIEAYCDLEYKERIEVMMRKEGIQEDGED